MRNLFVTVCTHLFWLPLLLLISKNKLRLLAAIAATVGAFLADDGMAGAATVTTTVQGTMLSGTDTGKNGQGVFGPAGDLTGKPFTLVYTFDDTQGQQYNTVTQGGQPTTGIKSTGNSFPGSAILTINGVSVPFGGAGGSQVPISYEDKINGSAQEIDVSVSDTIGNWNNVASINIAPGQNPAWNTTVDWEAPFYYALNTNSWFGTSGFSYGRFPNVGSSMLARGYFNPASISISGAPNFGSTSNLGSCPKGSSSSQGQAPDEPTPGGPNLPGDVPPEPTPSAMCGNPINAATGNKFQAEVDFIGATSTGLSFVRYYNSQDAGFTTLGAGWRTSWQRSLSISPNAVVANGADGRQDTFTNSNGVYTANPNVTSTLQAITSGVVITSYQLTTASDDIETYSPSGQLLRVTSRAGLTTTLGYDNNGNLTTVTGPFGHTLTFAPDGYRRIATMTVPDGGVFTYQYDAYGNLVSVTHPDNSVRRYLYEDSSLPNSLTGIIDENGARFATWAYDSQGRAIASQHAGGVELTTVSYGTNAATVTDPNHATHTYNFETLFGVVKPVSQTGVPVPSLGGKAFTYDANGFLASLTDYNNNIATYTHDARGDETSRTLASGTSIAHTISTTWHPTFHLPTQIVDGDRTTSFSYDANGNLTSKTAFAPGTNSTWSYSYTSAGQVLTATGPRGYVTSYTYDSKGDLTSITNPLGQVIRFTSYDADGRLLSMTDANGLITNITYNFRGEVTSRVAGTWRTIYTYDAAGQLAKLMLPDHSLFSFAHDAAHRLVGVTDHQGNRIIYTLDAASNRTVEQVFDTSNDLVRTHSYTYDAVNRLLQSIGAQGQVKEYHYDLNSNFRQLIDPLGNVTINRYDELNRLKRTLDPTGGDTALLYDTHDRLVHVHDPRSLSTLYNYNGLDEPIATISRDTGTMSKTYDAAGNVVTSTDARGVQTSYSYDALNRLTQAIYADGTSAAYSYDQGANGVGHLTGMKDVTGATAWGYEIHGLVQSKTQSSGGISLTTTFAHDSYGRLSSMTYPSGTVVAFDHDVNGQVRGISYQPPGASGMLPLLEGIHYQPFGPVHRWLMGNGADYIRRYDLDGRVKRILLPAGGDIALAYDAAGRITSIAETGLATKSFGYDKLNRLTGYANGSQSQTFAYDADGNRVGLVSANGANSATVAYSYDTKSNRLLSIATGNVSDAFGYDANGNTVSDQSASQNLVFGYDAKNRLASAANATLSLTYGVNGLGQRTFKANTSTAGGAFADPAQTYFLYDEAGHLIGQYNGAGAPQQETVWLGDLPVATIQNGSANYIAPDHLGAPHQITNGAQGVVWFWDHDPFGNGAPTGDIIYSLRLPGQFYDVITGLYYNGFRDYNPATGRYVESDPIGLAGGVNTYGYAKANPISNLDWAGLQTAGDFFNQDGSLSDEGLRLSKLIIPSNKLGNTQIPSGLSKWTTPSYCTSEKSLFRYQTHFYRNDFTGEPWYGKDYKTVPSGKGPNPLRPPIATPTESAIPTELPIESVPEIPDIIIVE